MKTVSENIYKMLSVAALLIGSWAHVSAEVFEGYPDIIVCETGKGEQSAGELIFYLESRDINGTVFYSSSFRSVSIRIGKKGRVQADTASINDCLDKTLEQLRSQGRTFNFVEQ